MTPSGTVPDTPAVLRVRMDLFERRLRLLEIEQAALVRDIDQRQCHGEECDELRELEMANDEVILSHLETIQNLRRQLQLLEAATTGNDDDDEDQRAASRRREFVESQLEFQSFANVHGAERRESIEIGYQTINRCHRNRFSALPMAECAICLEKHREGETLAWAKESACPHIFHADCLTSWLRCHDCCPLCRIDVINTIVRS